MIEFTLSRAAMTVCGVILLAAIVAPFTGFFENNENDMCQEQCDNISDMIDSFYESEAEETIISANSFLPPDSQIRFDKHLVIMECDGKEYRSFTKHEVVSDGIICGADLLKMGKTEDAVTIEIL